AERAGDLGEERARQIRLVAPLQERVAHERVDAIEEPSIDVRAEPRVERDAGYGDAAALAACLLPLLGSEGFEEGIEARIAAIPPVELAVATEQPARALVRRARRIVEEEG